MVENPRQRWAFSNRMVTAFKVERDTVLWDRSLMGFGVRVNPSSDKVYVARGAGPERAETRDGWASRRDRYRRGAPMGGFHHRARQVGRGADTAAGSPGPGRPTVANLAERYPEDHVTVNCKPTTARDARSVVYRYILPALGLLSLEAVESGQVENQHRRLACSPATANKVIKVLLHMYTLADDWWMVEDRFNPCRSVPKHPERKRKRRLRGSELDRLGQMLNDAALVGISAAAAATIRLMIGTGCRRSEVLTVRRQMSAPYRGKLV